MYSNSFKKLVQSCESSSDVYEKNGEPNPHYIGFCNPNADILILGKEKGFDFEKESKQRLYNESILNPKQWLDKLNGCFSSDFDPEFPYGKEMNKVRGGHTWSKYNKLNELIYGKDNFKYHFFISELSHEPSSYSKGIQNVKENVVKRLGLFNNIYFKEQFKVVILACNNYIEPEQIYNVFDCTYDGDEKGKFDFGKGNWFYTHHSRDGKRLVIHTRQLSMDVKNQLLEAMSSVIKHHLSKEIVAENTLQF